MEMWVLTTKLLQWYFLMPAFVGSAALHNGRTALFAQNHGTNWIAERRGAAGAGPFTDVTSRGQSRRAATMLTTQQCRHHRHLPPAPLLPVSVMLYSLYFDLPWKLYCFIDGMLLSYITDSCRYYIHLERAARVSQRCSLFLRQGTLSRYEIWQYGY